MSKIVHTVTVEVTEDHINEIIDLLNGNDIECELVEGQEPLTFDEVMSNKELLNYLCNQGICYIADDQDLFEIWNGDGFADFADYR